MKEQVLMNGILTEADVVKAYLRRIASKGGSVINPKKSAAGRRNAAKARAVRMAKLAAEKDGSK